MRAVALIAWNTFREILRDRILYGFLFFAVFLIFFSLILGELSFAEQIRITSSFGLSAVQLSAAFLAMLLGSTLLSREIEKKTILTILARPLSRWQFLLGKALGLLFLIMLIVSALMLLLFGILQLRGAEVGALWVQWLGVMLEAAVVLFVTLLLSTFSRPVLVVCMSVGIFLIGHWQSTLEYFAKRSKGESLPVLKNVLRFFIPDLETFNWKGVAIYQETMAAGTLVSTTLYALGWLVVLFVLASAVFERKELG